MYVCLYIYVCITCSLSSPPYLFIWIFFLAFFSLYYVKKEQDSLMTKIFWKTYYKIHFMHTNYIPVKNKYIFSDILIPLYSAFDYL